jgi:hypothetical protein
MKDLIAKLSRRRLVVVTGALVAALVVVAAARVHTAGAGSAVGPDVVVFALSSVGNYGVQDGFAGYSLGTRSCNRGDAPLNWCNDNGDAGCGNGTTDEDHPVIAQNLYRLKDGRFEQVGMSWLKHGFLSTNSTTGGCSGAQGQSCTGPPLGSNQLGIGCTDPYGSSLNGSQPLGRRSSVNAATGDFPYPYSSPGGPYSTYDQRIKVATSDLDPILNSGAIYWAEAQYVAPDDATSGNGLNNASYQQVTVGGSPNFNISLAGGFHEKEPAILAWPVADPTAVVVPVDVPGSTPIERFHVGRAVTDLGAGLWHYEYAVHNLNSDRSVRKLTINFPLGTSITNVGFHDIEHHSGEPYSTADWTIVTGLGSVNWVTDDFATDPNANALRWATAYSFWFDADHGPTGMSHSLELFKPGTPTTVPFTFAGSGVFADGFESGDTSQWSATEPP